MNQDYIIIEGQKVNKKTPFIIFENPSRQLPELKQSFQFNQQFVYQSDARRLMADTYQELGQRQFQRNMMRFTSLNSARSNLLFATHGSLLNLSQPLQWNYQNEKQTIFKNEFTDFHYQEISNK